MSTVDEILASGWYKDRRGRHWDHYRSADTWTHFPSGRRLTRAQMRLLIERDRHRDECKGLGFCFAHPVSYIIVSEPRLFEVFSTENKSLLYANYKAHTLPEAMDAARALAVGS